MGEDEWTVLNCGQLWVTASGLAMGGNGTHSFSGDRAWVMVFNITFNISSLRAYADVKHTTSII